MRYVTSIERQAMKKGDLEGEATVLLRLLTRRFGELPEWVEGRLAGASREELEGWADRVLEAEALDEVFA